MNNLYNIWSDDTIGVDFQYYPATSKITDAAVIILPGGAYAGHADHEGKGYAEMFNAFGLSAFVLKYRVMPNYFPLPLLDARRAVRYVRYNAEKFGIDKNKILVIGSSAGGHLTALLSTYKEKLPEEGVDEIDEEDCIPNGQILCYPVICSNENIGHMGSYKHLLGDLYTERDKFSPELLVCEDTPRAFIWHTSTDDLVKVSNSYRYAEALANVGVLCEVHVYPIGGHGWGTAKDLPYIARWTDCLKEWLILNKFL